MQNSKKIVDKALATSDIEESDEVDGETLPPRKRSSSICTQTDPSDVNHDNGADARSQGVRTPFPLLKVTNLNYLNLINFLFSLL